VRNYWLDAVYRMPPFEERTIVAQKTSADAGLSAIVNQADSAKWLLGIPAIQPELTQQLRESAFRTFLGAALGQL
jgi:hypothetical protein